MVRKKKGKGRPLFLPQRGRDIREEKKKKREGKEEKREIETSMFPSIS